MERQTIKRQVRALLKECEPAQPLYCRWFFAAHILLLIALLLQALALLVAQVRLN